jgi:hypothetical protein
MIAVFEALLPLWFLLKLLCVALFHVELVAANESIQSPEGRTPTAQMINWFDNQLITNECREP